MRVSVASTGREPPDHCDQKQSDQENTRDDRGVDVVEPHHLRFSAISPVPVRLIPPRASKMVREGRRGAWSGIPPPASASDDAKERGPQLPASLAQAGFSGKPERSACDNFGVRCGLVRGVVAPAKVPRRPQSVASIWPAHVTVFPANGLNDSAQGHDQENHDAPGEHGQAGDNGGGLTY